MHICLSPVRCALSSEWAFQTAKRPAGKFPISQCSVQCRLTTEGSEIHSCGKTAFSLSLFLPGSLSFPHPLHPAPSLSVSPDESEQRWKAFRNAGRQAVLYRNLTWGRWKPAGKLGIECRGRRWEEEKDRIEFWERKEQKGSMGQERE